MLGFPDITQHASLGGLDADDHKQYLLIDGTRAMTGGLAMDSAGPESLLDLQFNSTSKLDLDNRGILTLRPDGGMHQIPGFDFLQTIGPAGFFQELIGARISAQNSQAFGVATGLELLVGAQQEPNYIKMIGSSGSMVSHVGAISSVNLDGRGSLIMKNSSASANAPMLDLELTGGSPEGVFAKFSSDIRTEWSLDNRGNMLVGGAVINPRGSTGSFENESTFSEQLDQVGTWVATNMTVTPDFAAGPDGTPNSADRVQPLAADGNITQTFSALTAANNTFTVSMWGLRETTGIASTLRYLIEDGTGAEQSANANIGLAGQEDKWEFSTLTYTFSGTATGSPRLKIYFNSAGNAGQVWGVNFSQTDSLVGYSPTQDAPNPAFRGATVNGQVAVGSGKGPAGLAVRFSNDQGAVPCFSTQNPLAVTQFAIDPNGRDFTLDTVTGTKIGTGPFQKLGFWAATPIVQPTVAGSRAGNAALASLLTQLATMGLVVDTTVP